MNFLNDLPSFVEFNLDHLVARKEIAKDGSFSRAATRLHLSQPAASRAVNELDAASEKLLELRGTVAGCVRFGSRGTAAAYLLPPFLKKFHSRYP